MFGCRLSKLVLDRLNEIVLLPSLFHQPLAHNIHFPGGSVVKNLPVNSGDAGFKGLIPGSGRSLGGENGNPLQYCCLEKSHGQSILVSRSPWSCRVGYD